MLKIGSGAGTSAFVPVMSEMRKPEDYNKAVYSCMSWVTVCYLTYVSVILPSARSQERRRSMGMTDHDTCIYIYSFGLVIYRYCGQWVASPALGVKINLTCRVNYAD